MSGLYGVESRPQLTSARIRRDGGLSLGPPAFLKAVWSLLGQQSKVLESFAPGLTGDLPLAALQEILRWPD